MLAQALIEKGMLDGAIAGVSTFLLNVGEMVQARPYLLIVVAVVIVLLLRRRR